MSKLFETEELLGKEFEARFRVVAISACRPGVPDDPERTVTIIHLGDRAVISFRELRQLIETGFVVEVERAH